MMNVERPMVESASTSVFFRPIRSPKCPNSAEPTGRAKNASPNVASEASLAATGSEAGRKAAENQHGGRGKDVKVEILDGRADHAGKQNIPRSIDGFWGEFQGT